MSSPSGWRRLLADTRPLKDSPVYRRAWLGYVVSMLGAQMTMVALPIHVYNLTGSTLAVGLIGTAELLPALIFGLFGGAIVDTFDRRTIIVVTSALLGGVAATLGALTMLGMADLLPLLILAAIIASISVVDGAARNTLPPRLLPPDQIAAANALIQLAINAGLTVGPLIAGLLIAFVGVQSVYFVAFIAFLGAAASLWGLPSLPPERDGAKEAASVFANIWEGLRWVATQPVVLVSFLLDLDAMTFGMPRALFPALANEHYKVGPEGVGILYAAPAIGAFLVGIFSGPIARVRMQGIGTVIAIALWGAATVGFGLTNWLWLGAVFMAIAGAADMVSAVYRGSILQQATPDYLRGRLNSIYIIVVTSGPRLGDLKSGIFATVFTPSISAWSGGLISLVVLVIIVLSFRGFLKYRAPGIIPEPKEVTV